MNALPLAVRVAAGLAATAVERARKLPQDLIGLPVTAVSRAMQVSMRMQQQITELAIKGDNAIALLRTPSEEPPWAVFDEDDSLYRPPGDRTDSAAVTASDWLDAEDEDEADSAAAGTDDITEAIAQARHIPTDTPDETHHTPAEPEAQPDNTVRDQ